LSASASASFTVVYDACVLYPAALRDLLLRLALARLCRARWTEEILDEVFANLKSARPDLDSKRLAVTRRRMCEAVPESLVEGYQRLLPPLDLPDPGDRHVLAAAIRCKGQAIVTDNVRHFPAAALSPHGIEALTADQFVLRLMDLAPDAVVEVVRKQAAALRSPPCTVEALLSRLVRQGLKRSGARLLALCRLA